MNCSKFHEIKKCRVCGNEHLDVVLDLGDQYLSGIFPKEIDKDMYKGPLTLVKCCLLYTSPSPRDRTRSRMPSSA